MESIAEKRNGVDRRGRKRLEWKRADGIGGQGNGRNGNYLVQKRVMAMWLWYHPIDDYLHVSDDFGDFEENIDVFVSLEEIGLVFIGFCD